MGVTEMLRNVASALESCELAGAKRTGSIAEVEEFMRDTGAAVAVDSFYDDVSWVVAVRADEAA